MSLLVHELVIGTGSGGSGSSSLHSSPSKSSSIAAVAPHNNATLGSVSRTPGPLAVVTHTSNTLQFSQLQQSRVVAIASNHSRLSSSESGSKLAEALAGNVSFAYSTPLHVSTVSHSTGKSSNTAPAQSQWHHYAKSSARQSYNLPFVLQDHNYGAPPPPTPPHSPPLPVVSSLPPHSYKIQQVLSSNSGVSIKASSSFNSGLNNYKRTESVIRQKTTSERSNVAGYSAASSLSPTYSTSPSKSPGSSTCVAPQFLASMPLHRQHFMPTPRLSGFHSSHIPHGSNNGDNQAFSATGAPISNGIDTDDESRLSDRSSSVGPSGEETETAPEGDGEEQVQADDSITRCVCDFTHDDGYMIQCDRCLVWQHVDCMEIDRNNIPEEYLCEACSPRLIDKQKSRSLQIKRKQEIRNHFARLSSSDSDDNATIASFTKSRNFASKTTDRKVLKKKKIRATKEQKSATRKQTQGQKKASFLSPLHTSSKTSSSSDEKERKQIKSRRRQSSATLVLTENEVTENNTTTTTFSMEQLKSWVEDYEVAVTNHYSPELRARVQSARLYNGISPEFRDSTQGAMLGHRCKVAPSYDAKTEYFESKVLVATTNLIAGTAIIEFQGKYTLQSQWSANQVPPGLPYLPFVLLYTMAKECLGVCVDARTYGNDARFARRCKEYNAEVRHVVERGSVHLYIVASKDIEEEEEIFLSLDTAICSSVSSVKRCSSPQKVSAPHASPPPMASPIENAPISVDDDIPQPLEETAAVSVPPPARKNGAFQPKKGMKKQQQQPLSPINSIPVVRSSRRTASTESPIFEELTHSSLVTTPVKQRRSSGLGNRSPAKSPVKSPSKSPLKTPISPLKSLAEESCTTTATTKLDDPMASPNHDGSSITEKDMHKLTREERKIAAYMKAFERMEKAVQRKKDNAKRRNREDRDDFGCTEKCIEDHLMDDESMRKRRKKSGCSDSPEKQASDHNDTSFTDDNNCSSPEAEISSTPASSSTAQASFRFPKTKKALMNEWLNETVNPVLPPVPPSGSEVSTGVPTCYMRSPSTPARRTSGSTNAQGSASATAAAVVTCNNGIGGHTPLVEMAGRSAKKRWLRQAIIDETEPQGALFTFCSSPNSRPDSPNGCGDYTTPLKKRRLARESMSSEQSNTPPTTPIHCSLEEDKSSIEFELDHGQDESSDSTEGKDAVNLHVKSEDDIKSETCSGASNSVDAKDKNDQLSVNLFELCDVSKIKTESDEIINNKSVKKEIKTETGLSNTSPSPTKHSCRNQVKSKDMKAVSSPKASNTPLKNKKLTTPPQLKLDIRKAKNIAKNSNVKKNFLKRESLFEDDEDDPILGCPSQRTRQAIRSFSQLQIRRAESPEITSNKIQSKEKVVTKKRVKRKGKMNKELPIKKVDSDTAGIAINIETEELNSSYVSSEDLSPLSLKHLCQNTIDNSRRPYTPEPLTTNGPKTPEGTPPEPLALKGPKTPEGTPPETPVKDCFSPLTHEDTISLSKGILSPVIINNGSEDRQTEEFPSTVAEEPEDTLYEESVCNGIMDDSALKDIEEMNKPAPVKRKLSILEYRKRKSVSLDRDYREYFDMKSPSIEAPHPNEALPKRGFVSKLSRSAVAVSNKQRTSSPSALGGLAFPPPPPATAPPPHLLHSPLELEDDIDVDDDDDLSCSPPSPPQLSSTLKSYLESDAGLEDLGKAPNSSSSSMNWSSAPTLVERQRENLTARLRREFGLCVSDEPESNKEERKIAAGVLPPRIQDAEPPSPSQLLPLVQKEATPSLNPLSEKPLALQTKPLDPLESLDLLSTVAQTALDDPGPPGAPGPGIKNSDSSSTSPTKELL